MISTLSNFYAVNRRYARAINLERDFDRLDRLEGYIVTDRAAHALEQILKGVASVHTNRAWMLTSVYGTGKSAFAQFLVSLFAPRNCDVRQKAEQFIAIDPLQSLVKQIPESGLVRAVVTAQREPVIYAVLRALHRGLSFWEEGSKVRLEFEKTLRALETPLLPGHEVEAKDVLRLVREMAQSSQTGLLLVIDELGKCLEYAAQNRGSGDLYLLQQISELPDKGGPQVYLLGLLHQSFSEYGYGLGSVQRSEWSKIHGRFEEIPFAESPSQMAQLIGKAITHIPDTGLERVTTKQAKKWYGQFNKQVELRKTTPQFLADTFPLHPVATFVLPQLCIRYAQNDRSLFTFLTSSELNSFKNYLDEAQFTGDRIPLLKIDRLYDYFVESAGFGIASRPNFQRWSEVKSIVDTYRGKDQDGLRILKAIGVLNLAAGNGFWKVSPHLVALSLCEEPDSDQYSYWLKIIDGFIQHGPVIHRKLVDELRLWEGSDFDIEAAIAQRIQQENSPIVALLSNIYPLRPQVIQRHSYQTGTLRTFERTYLDTSTNLRNLKCRTGSDGFIGYWVEEILPEDLPSHTVDGKPFVLICGNQLGILRMRVLELTALNYIQSHAAQLQVDGVARRELRLRLAQAKWLVDEAFTQVFRLTNNSTCWVEGDYEAFESNHQFNARLSALCDSVYYKGVVLWNELINRQELTGQGSKALRELIKAMFEHPDQERLGLTGNGPEVSMYISVLELTGIHRQENGKWGLFTPTKPDVVQIWQAIEDFCRQAVQSPQSVSVLFERLGSPPYGIRQGVLPVWLAAFLFTYADSVAVYREGTFVPILGSEHFDVMAKQPGRFSLKYHEVTGLRTAVFTELEKTLNLSIRESPPGLRNTTLLNVVRPLLWFAKKLPAYTTQTQRVGIEARAVLRVLLQSQEADDLLFLHLPKACGLSPFLSGESFDLKRVAVFGEHLSAAFDKLQNAYPQLLTQCASLIYETFQVRSPETKLREDLRIRSNYLRSQCTERLLRRFLLVTTDETTDDKDWLEGILMILSDKPSASWNDTDVSLFEGRLSDLAERFRNLEALQKQVATTSMHGFDACRIVITRPDGQEVQQVVWIDHAKIDPADKIVAETLEKFTDKDRSLLEVFTARLLETVYRQSESTEAISIHSSQQEKPYEQKSTQASSRHLRRKG